MLCAELQRLGAEFEAILRELENPALTEEQKLELQRAYNFINQSIHDHQVHGHDGGPCFEE